MDEQTVELREVLGVLWRRKVILVAVTAATMVLAMWMSASTTPMYNATASLVIRPVVAPAQFSGSSRDALGLELSPESEAEIVRSPVVAQRVKAALDLDAEPQVIASAIRVRIHTREVLRVTATSTSPHLAAELANAFASEYINHRREMAAQAVLGHATDLRNRLSSMGDRIGEFDQEIIRLSALIAPFQGRSLAPRDAARLAELQAEIDRHKAERNDMLAHMGVLRNRLEDARNAQTASTGGGEVIHPAYVPVAQSTPRPKRDAALGMLIGLMLGIGAAYLREYFDTRIRSRDDATRAAPVPVLASIPRAPEWKRRKDVYLVAVADPGSATAEAYRSLRQSLTAMGVGRSIRTLLVTSGGPSAGKSATVANLAVACAQAGLRVAVVSGDLRRPRVHEFFGAGNEDGLSRVLSEDRRALDALVPTPVPGVSLLPSGPAHKNPAGLLDKGHLDQVIAEILTVSDVVLIDGPPLSSGADALVLAPRCDLSLLVMREGYARADGVSSAVANLTQAGVPRQAAVLNAAVKATRGLPLGAEAYGPMPAPTNGHAETHAVHEPLSNGHGVPVAVSGAGGAAKKRARSAGSSRVAREKRTTRETQGQTDSSDDAASR